LDIYDEILNALQAEDRVMLATIISTAGSTPASALSKMLVKQGGIVSVGTVGGGCMEGDVLQHANRLYQTGKAEILTFHLNEDDIENGLICGGSLDVLLEPLTKENAALVEELKTIRDGGEDCVLVTLIDNAHNVKRKFLANPQSGEKGNQRSSILHLPANLVEPVCQAHHRQETCRLRTEDGEFILEPISGNPDLVIFGGGHVSKFVSRTATMAGFRVTIVDDREKYANEVRFPEATRTLVADFQESFSKLTVRPSTYVVIVTRGHRYDEIVLELAIKTPAKYVGMIGSRKKVLTTYEHLVARGASVEALGRVHAPIGIDIGAVTAEEIGVSVVAELVKARRGEEIPLKHKSDEMKSIWSR